MLLEILIGLSIFTFSFLFILGAFPVSARSVHHARCYFLANQLAQQQMDAVMAQPYATIPTYIAGLSGSASVLSINNGTSEAISFTITTTSSLVGGNADLLDVRTQVSWSEQTVTSNQPFTNYVNVETLIANAP